jgi:hypothetical protein
VGKLPEEAQSLILAAITHCKCILLGGSWAQGFQSKDSDVDLIFICRNRDSKSPLSNLVLRTLKRTIRTPGQVIDGKVFTEEELTRCAMGKDNLWLYLMFRDGIIIHGDNLLSPPKLRPQLVCQIISSNVKAVEEAIRWIEQGILWDLVYHRLFAAVNTFKYAETLITGNIFDKQQRELMIQKFFGSTSKFVKQRYEAVRWQIKQRESGKLLVDRKQTSKRPKELSNTDLLQAAERIRNFGQSVYRLTVEWMEKI